MRARLASCLALTFALSGCIDRTMSIVTDPPGALVRLNGQEAGRSPVVVPFRHYGIYAVEIEAEGMATLRTDMSVPAPRYARFPAGLFTELLWPWTIRDWRYFDFTLRPPERPPRAELIDAADRFLDTSARRE